MFKIMRRAFLLIIVIAVLTGIAVNGGCSLLKQPQSKQSAGQDQAGPLPGVGTDTVADVVSLTSPAVVKISTRVASRVSSDPLFSDPFFRQFFGLPSQPRQEEGLGSGFIISKDGYILTNEHVIDGASSISVTVTGFDRDLEAKVAGADYDLDLALLKIEPGRDLPSLNLGDSDQIRVGNWVIAIGNPYGLDHTVTTGVISAKGRPISVNDRQYENLLQTDASINPGNSGGPLLDLKGEVIGINTAISSQAQGIGFAIPTSTVRQVLEDLKNNVSKSRPWVGVQVRTVDNEIARYLGLDKAEGAVIDGVIAGSPAESAGLREWDVIVEFNGKKISDADELVEAIKNTQAGQKVNISIIRQRQLSQLTVSVAEKPQNVR
ncbi:MAG: trypsin-like peptidase domain-containing protein [Desulfotomaculaceae bacterium]